MSFPARLHVLLARNSPAAVVIRRGPSDRVCTIGWDRKRDTFEEAQWLHGRIYERRSDLSPDGKHLIYFAMNGQPESETGGAWTAISRAPWLKAVVLLGKGDCWHGGGLFTGNRNYWLNDGSGHNVIQESSEVRRDRDYVPPQRFGGECPGVYYPRLIRHGWILQERNEIGRMESLAVFERPLRHGWLLRKLAHEQADSPEGKGCYWDEHVLHHPERGVTIALPDWEWTEVDGTRLVYASEGCLYAVAPPGPSTDALPEPTLLRDFNAMTFEARSAPYH
ncbi:MAG: hypothetical protein ACOYEV_19275 [Candidatus Nanopelagicales bacterium]